RRFYAAEPAGWPVDAYADAVDFSADRSRARDRTLFYDTWSGQCRVDFIRRDRDAPARDSNLVAMAKQFALGARHFDRGQPDLQRHLASHALQCDAATTRECSITKEFGSTDEKCRNRARIMSGFMTRELKPSRGQVREHSATFRRGGRNLFSRDTPGRVRARSSLAAYRWFRWSIPRRRSRELQQWRQPKKCKRSVSYPAELMMKARRKSNPENQAMLKHRMRALDRIRPISARVRAGLALNQESPVNPVSLGCEH